MKDKLTGFYLDPTLITTIYGLYIHPLMHPSQPADEDSCILKSSVQVMGLYSCGKPETDAISANSHLQLVQDCNSCIFDAVCGSNDFKLTYI